MSSWFGTSSTSGRGTVDAAAEIAIIETKTVTQAQGGQPQSSEHEHVEAQPWYYCMLPDCSGGNAVDINEQNEILGQGQGQGQGQSDKEAESRSDDKIVNDDTSSSIFRSKETRDAPLNEIRDDGPESESPTKRGQERSESETSESEGIPDSFFQTGSFESISGLSLASYGTTASAMLGGLLGDYDDEDEKVITKCLDDKDDESVVSEIQVTAGCPTETSSQAPQPKSTSITAEIESRKLQNLEVPTIHAGPESTDEEDNASVGTGNSSSRSKTNQSSSSSSTKEDDQSIIPENASMVSSLRRDRELNAIPLRKIKLMFKEGGMTDEERKHMLDLRSAIKSFGRHDLNVAHTLVSTGEYYAGVAEYKKAISLHEEALSIYSTKLGDHDSRSVDAKVRIGRVQKMQGNVDEAMETFCQTMHMREALLGEEHPSVGDVRMHVAEIQRNKGHPKEAAREVKKALRGYREAYGDDHPVVADAVQNIAELYTEMGEHEKANLIFSEIVKLRAAIDGSETVSVSKALMKWSWSFDALGNTSRALKLMKQAYAALVKQEGIAGATTAEALEGVGKIYAAIGRKDKAIKAYTRVLNIRRQTLGENDPTTAATFVTIGRTLKEVDQSEKSLKCMKRAMSIYAHHDKATSNSVSEKKEDKSAIADSLHQIGLTFEDHGENTLALKAFSKEMNLRKVSHYQDRRRIARVLNAIGVIQCKRGKYKNALEFFTEALINMDCTGGRNATFAATLFNVGLAQEKMGETEKAFQTYAETLMMYKSEGLMEDNPMVNKVINKIKKNPQVEIVVPVVVNGRLPCALLDDKTKFEC